MQAQAIGMSPEDIRSSMSQELFPTATKADLSKGSWAHKAELAAMSHGYKMDEAAQRNLVDVSPQDAERYGLTPGSKIDVRLLSQLHADTRGADNNAAKRYAADAASSRAIQSVFTGNYTDDGTPIMAWTRKADLTGTETLKTPSATEERVTKQAGRVQIGAGELQQELKDPNIRAQLGPIMGRYNSLAEWYGAPDPELTEFKAHLASWMALQPALHGFRGIGAMEHFEKLAGAPITTPEALEAAIRGINKTAKTFTPKTAGAPPARPAAGGKAKAGSDPLGLF